MSSIISRPFGPSACRIVSRQQANAASATVTIDRDRAARFGIQPALIDATIYDAIGQREVTQFFTQLNSYHVVLEVDPALQTDPRLFDKLYLTSPTTGQQVPLSYFVRVDMTKTGYLVINHQSQFPSVTVSFNLAGGASLGDADFLAWIISVYLLTGTAVTPLYGKLSDIHGRRPILSLALGVFLVGSVICALCSPLPDFIRFWRFDASKFATRGRKCHSFVPASLLGACSCRRTGVHFAGTCARPDSDHA